MVFIIDDDREFAECIARMLKKIANTEVEIFSNGIEAIAAMGGTLPELIFLDVLLDGPDGFTFLNEIMSYDDTKKIPVVIMSSLKFGKRNLDEYGVVKILDKAEMVPGDIAEVAERYCHEGN